MRCKIVRTQILMWRNIMRSTKSKKTYVLHYSIDRCINFKTKLFMGIIYNIVIYCNKLGYLPVRLRRPSSSKHLESLRGSISMDMSKTWCWWFFVPAFSPIFDWTKTKQRRYSWEIIKSWKWAFSFSVFNVKDSNGELNMKE